MGGAPLYVGQQYRFGAYAGNNQFGTSSPVLLIFVYDKRTNFNYVDTLLFPIPNVPQTNAWTQFVTNGFTMTVSGYGLKTVVSRTPVPRWGAVYESYLLTHEADISATNYLFEVYCLGFAATGTNIFGMAL
jgi:hypothetical protein